jgi:ribokinase
LSGPVDWGEFQLIPQAVNESDLILVVGSINMDIVISLQRAPAAGETVLGARLSRFHGGKGANQAVAAARLGGRVALLGAVGVDQEGASLREALAAEGIDLSGLRVLPGVPTGTALILVEATGENRIVVVPGANGSFLPGDLDVSLFPRARVVLISQEIPPETVARALQLAKGAGALTILNPAPARPISPGLLQLVDVLTPNRAEAALMAGRPVESLADARQAAEILLQRGARAVVLTLGEQGALVATPQEVEWIPAYQVPVVDTTAAGDAFAGALAFSLASGDSLLVAAGFAVAASAVAVTRVGAQPSLPSLQEVAERIRQGRSYDRTAQRR